MNTQKCPRSGLYFASVFQFQPLLLPYPFVMGFTFRPLPLINFFAICRKYRFPIICYYSPIYMLVLS